MGDLMQSSEARVVEGRLTGLLVRVLVGSDPAQRLVLILEQDGHRQRLAGPVGVAIPGLAIGMDLRVMLRPGEHDWEIFAIEAGKSPVPPRKGRDVERTNTSP